MRSKNYSFLSEYNTQYLHHTPYSQTRVKPRPDKFKHIFEITRFGFFKQLQFHAGRREENLLVILTCVSQDENVTCLFYSWVHISLS
jgi:hypothetical protein